MRATRHGILVPVASVLLGCATHGRVAEPAAVVVVADLDFADVADQAVLARRVDTAVLRLCERDAERRQLPPHYARAHPRACLIPMRKAIIQAAPAEMRRAEIVSDQIWARRSEGLTPGAELPLIALTLNERQVSATSIDRSNGRYVGDFGATDYRLIPNLVSGDS